MTAEDWTTSSAFILSPASASGTATANAAAADPNGTSTPTFAGRPSVASTGGPRKREVAPLLVAGVAAEYDSDEEVIGRSRRAEVSLGTARALSEQYRQYFHQSWIENKRNKCHYFIGCTSVFLVVFVVAAALSILNYSAVLFLGLAEADAGQIDLDLTPISTYFDIPFLNYSAITALVAANGTASMAYHTHRYSITATAYDASLCGPWDGTNDMDWSYFHTGNVSNSDCAYEDSPCLNYNCLPGKQSTLYMVDSQREAAMGLGRSWPFPPVPRGSCYITASVARSLKVSVGDTIIVSFKYAVRARTQRAGGSRPWPYRMVRGGVPRVGAGHTIGLEKRARAPALPLSAGSGTCTFLRIRRNGITARPVGALSTCRWWSPRCWTTCTASFRRAITTWS